MRGAAVPILLLLLLALTGMAHAAFLLSLEELRAGRSALALLQVRAEAEAALESAAGILAVVRRENGRMEEPGFLEVSVRNQGLEASVEVIPLSSEFTLLQAEAQGQGEGPRNRLGRVHWHLDPRMELRRSRAGVEYGGTLSIQGAGHLEAGAGGCPEGPALPTQRRRATHELPPVAPFPFLGILSLNEATQIFSGVPAGSRTGAAGSLGSGSTAFSFPAADAADPDFLILSHHWAGVLAVSGSLRIQGAARVSGLLLVEGDLILRESAEVEGVIRVGGDVRVMDEGRIVAEPCRLLDLFEDAQGLLDPIPAPGGSWTGRY